MAAADRLNPLDVWFLHLEDSAVLLHVGSVVLFEGPAPDFEAIRQTYVDRLPVVPRFRQVVTDVPLGLARPVWVDDPHFSIDYHVRHTALPPPGGDDELQRLVGRIMSQRLDRHRPLWEAWVVEGMADDHWAIVTKIHHSVIDGVAGTALTEAIFDASRDPARHAEPDRPQAPADRPSRRQLLADAVRDQSGAALGLVRGGAAALRHPRQSLEHAAGVALGVTRMAGLGRPAPPSVLSGEVSAHRRYHWTTADLAEVKTIKRALGGTVNDVVLTAVTMGFRAMLQARQQDGADVRALIPVSIRPPGAEGEMDNRVAALFAHLPVDRSGALATFEAVHAQMDDLKVSGEALASTALVQLTGLVPSLLLGPAMHLITQAINQVGQRNVNTVVTNVPGPQHPLYLHGRRALAWYPYVPIAAAIQVGVAVLSYNGVLHVGVTGDWEREDDVIRLVAGIEDGMAALSKEAAAISSAGS